MTDEIFTQYLGFEKDIEIEKPVSVVTLYHPRDREFLEVKIQAEATFERHSAPVPIMLLCLTGAGEFRFGEDLEEHRYLSRGDLLTLEAGIDHEIHADSNMHLLLVKFG